MPSAPHLAALILGGAVALGGCTTTGLGSSTARTSSGAAHVSSTDANPSSASTSGAGPTPSTRGIPGCQVEDLPAQVPPVIAAIKRGGPFAHPRNDGVTFGNRERRLPQQRRGFYREHTVDTPGAQTRGARRVITGGTAPRSPQHWYYTGDHYESFCEITNP